MPMQGRLDKVRALGRAALAASLSFGALACSSEADDLSMDGAGTGGVLPPSSGAGSGGGVPGSGGSSTDPGSTGTAGSGTAGGSAAGSSGASSGSGAAGSAAAGAGGTAGSPPDLSGLEPFSFFVTSLAAMQRLSGNANGFGGDLRYGEADGLSGADKICTEIAEASMPGAGAKGWRAFLSAVHGPDGMPVHAIDRIGEGPWYDRIGRLFAMDKAGLMGIRPDGDPAIVDDFPNEDGVGNHDPDGTGDVDNHDTLTGTDAEGHLYADDMLVTCNDWTTSEPTGRPRVGHAWPRFAGGMPPSGFPGGGAGTGGFMPPPDGFGGGGSGGVDSSCFMDDGVGGGGLGSYGHWISSLSEAGCAPVIYLTDDLNMDCATRGVGAGGGYGGIYCFALNP